MPKLCPLPVPVAKFWPVKKFEPALPLPLPVPNPPFWALEIPTCYNKKTNKSNMNNLIFNKNFEKSAGTKKTLTPEAVAPPRPADPVPAPAPLPLPPVV